MKSVLIEYPFQGLRLAHPNGELFFIELLKMRGSLWISKLTQLPTQTETLVVDCILDHSRHCHCFDVVPGTGRGGNQDRTGPLQACEKS
jgi:hypothetical protein